MISLPQNKVAVRYIQDPDMIGSLYIPQDSKERSDQGIVKYIGKDCHWVKPGDYVIFGGYTGTVAHIEGENGLIILPEDQIVAILHPPATTIYGLFHVDKDGIPFPATYESAIELIREAYDELPRFANLKDRRKEDV